MAEILCAMIISHDVACANVSFKHDEGFVAVALGWMVPECLEPSLSVRFILAVVYGTTAV